MPHPFRAPSLTSAALALALACLAPVTRADCVDGVREPTAGERAFVPRAAAALAAALPAPPANTELRGRPFDFKAPPQPGSMCRGQAEGAFVPSAGAGYLYRFPRAEADRLDAERRAVAERILAIEALPPEKEAERKALEDQARAAYAQAPRRSRSDPPFTPEQQAEVDRRTAEGNALMQRSRAVTFAHQEAVKPQTNALRAEERRLETFPQEFTVRLQMNVAQPPAAGSTPEAEVVVLGPPAPGRSAGLRVTNVVLSVAGRPGPARKALFDAVDAAWLQSLLGKPPPEVAASEAQAAKVAAAAPAPVAAPAAAPVATPAVPPAAVPAQPAPATAQPAAAPPTASPAPTAAPAPAAAPVSTAPPAGTPPANCPPRGGQSGQAASAGAAIGGALFGGGFGRSVGNVIGGAVDAVAQTPPGCPN